MKSVLAVGQQSAAMYGDCCLSIARKTLKRHHKDTLRAPGISGKMYHVKVDREHRRTLVLFFIPLAKKFNCFPPLSALHLNAAGLFCAIQPCSQDDTKTSPCNPARPHLLQKIILPVSLCPDFYIEGQRGICSR